MPRVTVSPKYQVVIPKEVREKLGIQTGTEGGGIRGRQKDGAGSGAAHRVIQGRFPDLPPFGNEPDRL